MNTLPPHLKVLIAGDRGVGKSTIIKNFVKYETSSTNWNLCSQDITNPEANPILIREIDQRFANAVSTYFRTASVIFLVYDVTNRRSFLNIPAWIEDIHLKAAETTTAILVGSKTDIGTRQVSTEEGEKLACEHDVIFLETSEGNANAITSVFSCVIEHTYNEKMWRSSRGVLCNLKKSPVQRSASLPSVKIPLNNIARRVKSICSSSPTSTRKKKNDGYDNSIFL